MRIPYGYILVGGEIAMDSEKGETVRSIFAYYLVGAGLGKVVDMLCEKGIPSPTGNLRWTRAAVDKLLGNAKYIPMVGLTTYMDIQFEKDHRCNINYGSLHYSEMEELKRSCLMKIKLGEAVYPSNAKDVQS